MLPKHYDIDLFNSMNDFGIKFDNTQGDIMLIKDFEISRFPGHKPPKTVILELAKFYDETIKILGRDK